ncbi:MAG: D-lyxose/D-mannose family sugar isomerase [Clostridia bacterium]|nr:D-lyxose/D-mannose family sugar isomerase [Clostridia bacterium]
MKRSEINRRLLHAMDVFEKAGFHLPPFAHFSAESWADRGHEYDEIRENMLGWDITDFGWGSFDSDGLLLLTIRNGKLGDPDSKTYAEKLMLVQENQVTPMHFHWNKMEDIINRGGGNLMIKVYLSDENEQLSDKDVPVTMDGVCCTVPAGTVLRLTPGQSITMQRGLYHSFWGEEGCGEVIVGEVSMVNDDNSDNRFYKPAGRFPAVEEDEAPLRLLCNEYPKAK